MNHTWQVVNSIPYLPEFSFPCLISISDLKPFCLFSAVSEYHLFFRALYECHLQQLVHAKELNRTSWYCPQMEAAQSSLRKSYGILHAHSIYHRLQRTFNTSLGYLAVFASKGHIKHYSIVHMARLRGSVRLRCSPKISNTCKVEQMNSCFLHLCSVPKPKIHSFVLFYPDIIFIFYHLHLCGIHKPT